MSDLNPLTSAELSDLKAKAKAATPGTWYADLSGDHYHTDAVWAKLLSGEPNHICLVGASELEQQNANAEYIAAMEVRK